MKDFPELYEIIANHQLMTDDGVYPDELTIRRSLQLREKSPKFFVGDLATKRFFVSDQLRDLMGFTSNSIEDLGNAIADRICHDIDRRLFLNEINHVNSLTTLPESFTRDLYYRIRTLDGKIAWIYHNYNVVPNYGDLKKSLVVGTITKLNAMYLFNQTRGRLREEGLSRDIIELLRENMGSSVVAFQLPMFEVDGVPVSEHEQDIFLMRVALLLNDYCDESIRSYRLKNQLFVAFVPISEFDPKALAEHMNGILKTIALDLGLDPIEPCCDKHVYDGRETAQVQLLSSILNFIATQPKINETYDETDSVKAQSLSTIEALDVLRSISDNFSGFKYLIQPVVDSETRKIKVGEVLLRSRDFRQGISPGRFVPLLEDSRMIVPFARHTFDQSVDFARQLKNKGLDVSVSVNISPIQLIDEDAFPYIRESLKASGIEANRFVFELTENSQAADPEQTHTFLMKCRELGIRLAIDDFGEGANMLDRIFKTPFDIVKFSRNMSMSAVNNVTHLSFLSLLAHACHEYGAQVCLEGIEDEGMLVKLKSMKPDLYQGYLFSKPVDIQELLGMLDDQVSC